MTHRCWGVVCGPSCAIVLRYCCWDIVVVCHFTTTTMSKPSSPAVKATNRCYSRPTAVFYVVRPAMPSHRSWMGTCCSSLSLFVAYRGMTPHTERLLQWPPLTHISSYSIPEYRRHEFNILYYFKSPVSSAAMCDRSNCGGGVPR